MPIVSVLSLKGGVGKTSIVLGLAGAATVKGLATLVIDLDPQGNATSILAAKKPRVTAAGFFEHPTLDTLHEALTPCAWEVAPGEVDVICSTPDLIKADAFKNVDSFKPKLAKALRRLEGYDLVLIDCPPSLGSLTRQALAASNLALVVTTPSYFGLQGAERAAVEIKEIRKKHNPGLELLGVLPNRVKNISDEHDFRIKELGQLFGKQVLKPAIPDRIAVQQAEGFGQPVQTIKGEGAREVSEIFEKHLNRIMRAGKK
jgi:cellulose biosynthesis protein BcsQ